MAVYRGTTARGVASAIARRTKHRAGTQRLPWNLSQDAVIAILHKQKWRCALTGIALQLPQGPRRGFAWDSISCDRIVARDGYMVGNVRFVLNAINLFRNDGPDERMYMLAEALLRHREAVRKAKA